MKKLVLITMTGLLSTQSYAQSLGNRIEVIKDQVGNAVETTVDQSSLWAELTAKKSILASLNTAQEINSAVGLDTLQDEYRFAIPLVAVGALYMANISYQVTDFSFQQIRQIVPEPRIQKFINEAKILSKEVDGLRFVETNLSGELTHLESELSHHKEIQTRIQSRIDAIKLEIQEMESKIQSIRQGITRHIYTTPDSLRKANQSIAEFTQNVSSKNILLSQHQSELTTTTSHMNDLKKLVIDRKELLAIQRSAIVRMDARLTHRISMIAHKTSVRNALSHLGSALRGTIALGGILVGTAIISDVVILTLPRTDVLKFKAELESDIQNIESLL